MRAAAAERANHGRALSRGDSTLARSRPRHEQRTGHGEAAQKSLSYRFVHSLNPYGSYGLSKNLIQIEEPLQ
jgi:hypothetical protein